MPHYLTEQQLADWNDNGFLVVENYIPPVFLADFDQALRRIIRFQVKKATDEGHALPEITVGRELNDGLNALEAVDHAYVSDVVDFLGFMPERLRMASMASMGEVVNQLLGTDILAPLYLTNSDVVFAQPFDEKYKYGWHKDSFYTIPESEFVLTWAPLVQDATSDLGCLQVAPGSHVSEWRGQKSVEGVPNRHRFQVTEDEINKWKTIEVPMKLGSMLFFHPGLAHRSGDNTTDTTRISLVGFYHRVENMQIRPLQTHMSFKGKTGEEYFSEKYGL